MNLIRPGENEDYGSVYGQLGSPGGAGGVDKVKSICGILRPSVVDSFNPHGCSSWSALTKKYSCSVPVAVHVTRPRDCSSSVCLQMGAARLSVTPYAMNNTLVCVDEAPFSGYERQASRSSPADTQRGLLQHSLFISRHSSHSTACSSPPRRHSSHSRLTREALHTVCGDRSRSVGANLSSVETTLSSVETTLSSVETTLSSV